VGILLKFEERRISSWIASISPYGGIPLAFLVAAVIMQCSGIAPLAGFTSFFEGAVLNPTGLAVSLARSTAFLFMAVGIGLSFKANVLNIGAEGQYLMGAIAATAIAMVTQDSLPLIISLAFCLLGAAAIGALWASVAGYLRAYMGVNEIITTVMMNILAFKILQWLLRGPLKNPASQQWPMSPPLKTSIAELVPGTTLNAGFILALLISIWTYFLLYRTVQGYKIRVVGSNPSAATYGGINVRRTMVYAIMYSGALAGLAGAVDVLGVFHFLYEGISIGLGYTSVVVALIGKTDPLLIVPASILFGITYNGFTHMQSALGVPYTLSKSVEGMIYLFILLIDVLTRYRIKVIVK
jgi:ABC-type uncharacterized transport system permease subunit